MSGVKKIIFDQILKGGIDFTETDKILIHFFLILFHQNQI